MIADNTCNKRKTNRLCPFVLEQNPNCYCININSQKIRLMTEYCMAEYEECPYYSKLEKLKFSDDMNLQG